MCLLPQPVASISNFPRDLKIMEIFINITFLLLLFFRISLALAQNTTISINVGVVLDLDNPVGKMGLSCINMALSDFYASHAYYRTRLVLHTRDSSKDVVVAAAAALELINSVKVQAIIGPESSMQASFVTELGDKAQAFQWSEAVPITVDNEFGKGIIPYLTTALQAVGARITYWVVIPQMATADQIDEELDKLMKMQIRVFIVHMLPSLGTRLFARAKELGMMDEGFAWIVTNAISNYYGSLDSSFIDNMQGVLGLKAYVPKRDFNKTIQHYRV